MRLLKYWSSCAWGVTVFSMFVLFASVASAASVNCEGIGGSCTSGGFCTDLVRYEATAKSGTSCETNTLFKNCCVPKATAGECAPANCKSASACTGSIDATRSCAGASNFCCQALSTCASGICVNDEASCTNGVDTAGSCPGQTCCKAPSGGASCSGKDSNGTVQSGTCAASANCAAQQTKLDTTGGTACPGGNACCFSAQGSGTCAQQGGSCVSSASCTGTSLGQFDCSGGQTCCKSDSGSGTSQMCAGASNPGIVPCGRSCDNPSTPDDETKICTLCHLLVLMRNITDWIFRMMTYIAFVVLVAMGVLYIISAGRPQMINIAKGGIWAALVGFAVVLLGWVAVNVILFVLANGALGQDTANFSIKTNGSWFEYTCDAESKYKRTGIAGTGTGGGGGGGGGTGGGPGNGSCSVIASGYCTTENLGKACSWNAEAASKVCNVESGGNTAAASDTDRCQNESGDRFSFGLFQLNIIANGCMLGDDCCWQNVFSLENGSAANNGGAKKRCTNSKGVSYVCGWGCSVKNRAKYTECSNRAMDAAKNIQAACTLYKQSGWDPWPVTRKRCGL